MNTSSDFSRWMNEERIGEALADALIAGAKVPAGMPTEWSAVVQVFEALRNLPTPQPRPIETDLTATMAAVVRGTRSARTSRRLRRAGKITTLKVALVGAVFVGATAAAAATGTLPAPVQHVLAHALAHVDVSIPTGSRPTPPPRYGSTGGTRVSSANAPGCSGLGKGGEGCDRVSRHGERPSDSGGGKRVVSGTCRGRAVSVKSAASGRTIQVRAHCPSEPVAHTGSTKAGGNTARTTTHGRGRGQTRRGKPATKTTRGKSATKTRHGKGVTKVKSGSITTTTKTGSTATKTTHGKGGGQTTHGKSTKTTHGKGASNVKHNSTKTTTKNGNVTSKTHGKGS